MTFCTTDLCDEYESAIYTGKISVLPPVFKWYGKARSFYGQAVTLKVHEDNTLIKQVLENENGTGKVLIIDAGSSLRCAVVGGNLASAAVKNGWSGIIVDGCVRDALELEPLPIGVLALGLHPLRAIKRNTGIQNISVELQHTRINPNDWIYADVDGVIVSSQALI